MATLATLLVVMGMDTTGLKAGAAQAESSVGKFGAAAKVAFAVAALAAVKFGADAVQAAEESERVLSQLKVAVGDNTAAYEAQATALQSLTGFQDEEILSADTVLARFRLTSTEITQLTPLVLDYARATGQDAASAAGSLGKALLGNTRALKAIGVDFTATGDKAKDLAAISKLLEDRVGGAAEAFGKTFAGKLAITSARFDDLKEEVGRGLIPVLATLLSAVIPIVNVLTQMIPLLLGVAAGWAAYKVAAAAAAIAQAAFNVTLGLTNPILLAIAASVALVTAAFITAGDAMDQAKQALIDLTQPILREAAANKLAAEFGISHVEALRRLDAASGEATRESDDLTKALIAQKQATNALREAIPDLIGAVLAWKQAQKELNRAQDDGSLSAAELKQKELGVVEAFLSVKSAFGDVLEKYKDGTATVRDVIGQFKETARAAGLTRSETLDLIDVIRNYIAALRDVPSVVHTSVTAGGSSGVPHMQHGGIVTRPTLALVGEAGPEAVIPLNRSHEVHPVKTVVPNGGGGGDLILQIDGQTLARVTREQLLKLKGSRVSLGLG